MIKTSAIFLFLNYCLGKKVDMSMVVAKIDWRQLYTFASRQALLGFCFDGIERLTKEFSEELKQNPMGRDLLMTWMAAAQQIRRQNMKVNAVAGKLYSMLREDGLRCCILKGQGNALMYPNAYSRNPGDIDVWVNASREQITEYAKKHFKLGDDIRYQHIETSVDGVPVELHFFPCTMNNPIYNARLQKWFKRNADLQCSNVVSLPDGIGKIAIPTTAFNVIYQLTHLYHHFFDEGIGMRQIIDYFLVVNDFSKNVFLNNKSSKITPSLFTLKEGSTSHPDPLSLRGEGGNRPTRCSEPLRSKDGGPSKVSPNCAGWDRRGVSGDTGSVSSSSASGSSITSVSSASTTDSSASTALDVVQRELKYLGLWKFAGAVMYVLHEVLGLAEDKMIVPVDEKRGKLLLAEILDGGNFGRHFTKYAGFTHQSMGKKYFLKIWRNMHFVRYYPAEALCEPLFRTWHFFWRLKNKIIK
ncbi:nucleotidyltransferase family protein [Prevotella copri]|uniref:Nucleotidyltransferase family protein n=2 Tax=Segatella copri TaxID=165179 RepID=A0AAW4N7S3_9BACT|nr:nucleotidyltransferase family protein [Segatella copri]MBV3399093.1 nucleotidyltransferase family protein [Segatella copri]MBV3408721.1 nucleotidyltransferase family protein [Segatella copri]MBV3411584.1 nucleotidyltransferase family protein [Segatella copri]MBV3420048.1 nucleotidyltransferase family protein [Segatella copri]